MSDSDRTAVSTVDIDAWLAAAKDNPTEYRIRRVMRIILFAVADSPLLKSKMVIKGGILLAIGYGTNRHTKDLDFSTEGRVQEVDADAIIRELDSALKRAVAITDPEVVCRVQSHKMQPPWENASFPTLRIKVGYAIQGERAHRRMVQGGESPHTVIVDLSFNEKTCHLAKVDFGAERELAAYSIYDQVAEKYRALIQQTPALRGRVRRQDVYDIFMIIEKGYLVNPEDKLTLLEAMVQKFSARDVPLNAAMIDDPEVLRRSQVEYGQLAYEIEGALPDFENVFETVRLFYRSLPWKTMV